MLSLLSLTITLLMSPSSLDPKVLKEFEKADASHHVLLLLKDQANLDFIDEKLPKDEKTKVVYQHLSSFALQSQAGLAQWLQKNKIDFKAFYITNAIVIYNPKLSLLRELAKRDDLRKIILDPKMKLPPLPKSDSPSEMSILNLQSSIEAVGATRVWKDFGIRGEGIVVASQDTGVEWDHPALLESYRGWKNGEVSHDLSWHDAIHRAIGKKNSCGYRLKVPCDDHAHGTHTLGTILGEQAPDYQIGVAPKAKWMACRNMDEGEGRVSTYLECFEFFLAPWAFGKNSLTDGRPQFAADIINNSWGCTRDEGCRGAEFLEALYALKKAGIFVVTAAGNEGPDCQTIGDPPASISSLNLRVGAINHRNQKIADFSSRGPSTFDHQMGPDIVAPGVDVLSAVPGSDYESWDWSGTSMASPHVAGIIALLWSAQPSLRGQIEKTKQLIFETAKPRSAPNLCGENSIHDIPNNTYGYGIIDAYEIIKRAKTDASDSF